MVVDVDVEVEVEVEVERGVQVEVEVEVFRCTSETISRCTSETFLRCTSEAHAPIKPPKYRNKNVKQTPVKKESKRESMR